MTNQTARACDAPGCTALAVEKSIYCAAHQTKDSHVNRQRKAKPVSKKVHSPTCVIRRPDGFGVCTCGAGPFAAL
jgi:hypothetical protein